MNATVYKSTGSWYLVKDEEGRQWNARIRGALKIDDITSTNPIAVGDIVEMDLENDLENTAIITGIVPRRNYVNRQSPAHKMQHHIIAANIDQAIIFATLREPRTSQGFIDRFLVTCEAYHVPAIIVFNKSDLYRTKELEKFADKKQMYEHIGYRVVLMSLKEGTGLEELKAMLKNVVTLISGHSGVGKSTFINILFPQLALKTQEVSDWSGKGLHTTTFAEMFDLPGGGQLIDTPGLREFGMTGIERQELSHYYPEMRDRLQNCQFNNCLHIHEPGCAIKEAVENGEIHPERYISYAGILATINDKHY